MLYFHALLNGLAGLPEADEAVRAEIEARAQQAGWPQLHRELTRVDPDAAARIEPGDKQRIQRALEVWHITGERMSALQGFQAEAWTGAGVQKLVVCPAQRSLLHKRIGQRFKKMMQAGFLAEMEGLFGRPDLNPRLPAMRCVGYRQGWQFLAGRCNKDEFTAATLAATRQLAKRQLTWLRHEPATLWYDHLQSKVKCPIFNKVEQFLELPA